MKKITCVLLLLAIVNCKQKPKEETKQTEPTEVKTEKKDAKMDYTAKTKQSHAVKTQLYKWFSFYEREMNEVRTNNQLSILSDSVEINSMGNKVVGKAQYQKIVPMYKGTKNAHQLKSFEVTNAVNENLNAAASIQFQTIRPDSSQAQMKIAYKLALGNYDGTHLPTFNKIDITPLEKEEFTTFKDTYPENRVAALMYCWLFNVEQMTGDAAPFRALLADKFELRFSEKSIITNFEEFKKWIKVAGASASDTNHFPENFSVKTIGDNLYELNVDFVWRGATPDGVKLQAHTVHKWTIEDNIDDMYAKIRKIEVSYKIPFSPLKE